MCFIVLSGLSETIDKGLLYNVQFSLHNGYRIKQTSCMANADKITYLKLIKVWTEHLMAIDFANECCTV